MQLIEAAIYFAIAIFLAKKASKMWDKKIEDAAYAATKRLEEEKAEKERYMKEFEEEKARRKELAEKSRE